MYKLFPVVALVLGFSLAVPRAATAQDHQPWVYVMMKKGQLIEVDSGRKTPVTHDIVLIDGTTIHRNGLLTEGSGKWRKLRNGEFITMKGQIWKLKDLKRDRWVDQ